MTRIYQHFGLPVDDETVAGRRASRTRTRRASTAPTEYTPEQSGFVPERVRRRFAAYTERFGIEPDRPRPGRRPGKEAGSMIPDFTGTALSQLWSLDGRVAVVTGGGSGMGQATSLRLAEAGAAVAVADIDRGQGQGDGRPHRQAHPGRAGGCRSPSTSPTRRRCARSATR